MPITKNAYTRYLILDNCFRNTGRRYCIDDLVESCNRTLTELDADRDSISKKQLYDDIAFMESPRGWSIDLERTRINRKVYFRYTDVTFSINNMPLNELEIRQLQSAMEILSRFKGIPQFEWMQELLPRLKQNIGSDEMADVVIEFDNNPYLKGIEYIGPLYNAIVFKRVLQIGYQPYESAQPFNIVLHPYYLKRYNNRWFLFGYNPENDRYNWNLALDRIQDIREIKNKYRKNAAIDWSEYFEDIIGVTKPENAKVEKIMLHFFHKACSYVKSKPIHGSQKSKWLTDSTLEVTLELVINFELEKLLLSFCEDVKVLKPFHLAKRIQDRLKKAGNLYE